MIIYIMYLVANHQRPLKSIYHCSIYLLTLPKNVQKQLSIPYKCYFTLYSFIYLSYNLFCLLFLLLALFLCIHYLVLVLRNKAKLRVLLHFKEELRLVESHYKHILIVIYEILSNQQTSYSLPATCRMVHEKSVFVRHRKHCKLNRKLIWSK